MTSLALVAFAANSVLCRMALGDETIDPSSFTSIRLVSGVVVLALLARLNRQEEPGKKGWLGPVMLFVYAIAFSYAYVSLDTGTGALILFGAVQITMIVATH
jgi:drug/metabolite transporter (DMT)-like permease